MIFSDCYGFKLKEKLSQYHLWLRDSFPISEILGMEIFDWIETYLHFIRNFNTAFIKGRKGKAVRIKE